MIDQTKVTSGFDIEFLMGEEYIRYFLLCSLETGSIPWWSESIKTDSAGNVISHDAIILHPPIELQQRRLYPVHPDFVGHEHPFQDLVNLVYSSLPEEFKLTILPDSDTGADIRLRLFPSIIQDLHTPAPKVLVSNLLPIDLDIRFDLVFNQRADGLLDDIGVQLELIDISGALIEAAEDPQNQSGFSKADTLQSMKDQIDRTVPFSMSGGSSLQRIETRKFLGGGDAPNAIGVYINLALQDGPEPDSFLADRGDASLAQNFLAAGEKMGFAFPGDTYLKLGRDFKFKMAKPDPDSSGDYYYPIKDADDNQVGTIKDISVYPNLRRDAGQPPLYDNILVIDIEGEYEVEDFFDPDFHLRIRLEPTVKENGLFDFDVNYDLTLSAEAYLVTAFLGIVVTSIFPSLGLSLLASTPLILRIVEEIAEDAAGASIQSKLEHASFLDAIPHKLLVELRRWDPLYFTHHRVETAGVDLQVNQFGFAFDARELFIGRMFKPLEDMVIRSETRDADGALNGLMYRANGLGSVLKTDLVKVYPATDRMPYGEVLAPQGDIESYRVSLSIEQTEQRMAAEARHVKEIDYLPEKVDVIENQIYQILAISKTEIPEIEDLARGRLYTEIRNASSADFRQQAIQELQTELGRAPTEDEITARFNQILEHAVAVALRPRLRIELDHRMKFDLEPQEFADLQKRKILILGRDHLVIRKRTWPDGEVTIYYRDFERPFEPNTPKWDNLMALPRYKHEGV